MFMKRMRRKVGRQVAWRSGAARRRRWRRATTWRAEARNSISAVQTDTPA